MYLCIYAVNCDMFADWIHRKHSDTVWPFLAALIVGKQGRLFKVISKFMIVDSTWLATGDVCSSR